MIWLTCFIFENVMSHNQCSLYGLKYLVRFTLEQTEDEMSMSYMRLWVARSVREAAKLLVAELPTAEPSTVDSPVGSSQASSRVHISLCICHIISIST